MEFEKDKDTKEKEIDDKVKSTESVSIKDIGSPEKRPLSDDDNDDDDDFDDDRNNSDSKSSSVPGTDDKKRKP